MNPKPTILIVDDVPANLVALKQVLRKVEADIISTTSGNEALSIALKQDLALVLLDVQMPGMDGYEVADLMRGEERTCEIPIIFLTAVHKDREHKHKGYGCGAVDYLEKPFDEFMLLSKVKIFLELWQYRNQLEQRIEERTRELRLAKEEAEQANEVKSQFFSRMSHELRTPLNAILGFSELLQLDDENLNGDQREGITHILSQGRRLLGLVNEVLDIAKLDANEGDLSIEQVPLEVVLDHTLVLITPMALRKGLTIQALPTEPLWVEVDAIRLKQALVNLLSNAIKYTQEGGEITISIEGTKEGLARLSIRDTGVGIKDEDQAKIFEPFQRLEVWGEQIEGTGIGLTITKKLIESMGGRVGFKSEHAQGSTFWIDLHKTSAPTDILEPGSTTPLGME